MLVLAVPLALAGCQTWGPTWSEVTGARFNRAIMDRRPAIIEQIDGRSAYAENPIKIEPGPHLLVVQGPAPRRPGGGTLQDFKLDAAPCKRYYVNAQFSNPVQLDWEPVIDYVEDIAGCKVPAK
jgi:hypothetical protein